MCGMFYIGNCKTEEKVRVLIQIYHYEKPGFYGKYFVLYKYFVLV